MTKKPKSIIDKALEEINGPLEAYKTSMASITTPSFDMARIPTSATNPAEWTYERLGTYIQNFESNLDDEHEIGGAARFFGRDITFHISSVGYHGPDIIDFQGVNEHGENVQLIQNISQLSVLLVAMKKLGKKPRRIGFIWDDDEDDDDS